MGFRAAFVCTAVFSVLCSLAPLRANADQSDLHRLREVGASVKEAGGAVVDLRIDCTDLTDSDFKMVGGLKSLKSISISGKPMFDRHLAMLAGLKKLEAFQINGTQLTDDGYRHFAAFANLRRLSLFHPSRDVEDFTGAGLVHLKSLPNLRQLTFAGATAGDAAFQAVGELKQLEQFSQWHNWESSKAVKHLSGLRLKKLKMGQRLPNWSSKRPASLDDGTLEDIAKMDSLETVELQEARLSLAGLAQLKALPNLKLIKLKWVDVTEAEIEKLQTEMPSVTIQWEPLTDDDNQNVLVKKLKL